MTCRRRIWRGASRHPRGQAAFTQPLNGTDLLPPVGSPAARIVGACRLALAFGEKAHRLIIIPPSSIAAARNGCDLSVLLKYKDLYFGVPIPTPQHSRRSEAKSPHQALSLHWMSRDYPVTVLFFSSSISLITSFSTEFAGTRKPCKNSTVAPSRNGNRCANPDVAWVLAHSACCEVRANLRARS